MFSRKKEERPRRSHEGRNLQQYGLFDVSSNLSFDDPHIIGDNDDSDLEAELAAITSGSGVKPPPRQKKKPAAPVVLEKMVAESLRDIPSDEELSGDDDDPDLLNELSELTHDTVEEEEAEPEVAHKLPESMDMSTLLNARLQMYRVAEENAKKNGETSRARRFNRGIKTLTDMIKQFNAGRAIDPSEIPPEVSTVERPAASVPVHAESEPQSEENSSSENKEQEQSISSADEINQKKQVLLQILNTRQEQYKVAALQAKKSGDTATAISYMKISKQFDVVIKAVENDQDVDLSKMPDPPGQNKYIENQPVIQPEPSKTVEESEVQMQSEDEPHLIKAETVLEALEQRLAVYKKHEEDAKSEGNSSKARRFGRIVKQFEQALKAHKNGKPVAFDDLPTPPGFAPIPGTTPKPLEIPKIDSDASVPEPAAPTKPTPVRPAPLAPLKPTPPSENSDSPETPSSSKIHTNKRQLEMLLQRQNEFKQAALEAKRKGEVSQAKELLRTAKGFDRVIEAARCGLPVDMDSLPLTSQAKSKLEDDFDFVMSEECKEDDTGTFDILTRLETTLNKQLKMCLATRDHHKALGDVAGTNRFEHLALAVTRDLDIIRLAQRTNSGVPKFHYEQKSFNIVKCCTDLNDNDFEVNILRGINYNCPNPKDVDTYVKFEFPYPQEEPYKDKTSTVKDTNNPEYNASFVIPIQRTARPCLRVFKRHSVKFEVYSKGGFFRGDTLMGTVQVKLQPLETQCELHESFDLMDGRKKVGGKLEIKLRVRHPLVAQEVQQLNEKWLVLDH